VAAPSPTTSRPRQTAPPAPAPAPGGGASPTAPPTTNNAGGGPPPGIAVSLSYPLPGYPIVSKYGWRVHPILGVRKLHEGIDIWAPEGTPIKAAAGGVVVWAGPRGGYGNAVIIDHGSGVGTVYAHQSSVAVGAGQSVSRGQVIGYVGHTGLAGGPHLHFEVRVGGRTYDPLAYVHPG
jgi:murein DD-endopeptidase MepM/ murein hydrolase activator NlpD